MGAVCGYYTSRYEADIGLEVMSLAMKRRGAFAGHAVLRNQNGSQIGMAYRNITDSTNEQQCFKQPLKIVLDGEIYNLAEVAGLLGIAAKDASSEYVILKAFEKWGEECPKYFNGAFAFVIADTENDTLFCARDRFGERPFFYYHTKDDFVFASELKAVMLYPFFKKQIDTDSLGMYLSHNFISAPDSIFVNTYKLQPGCCLVCKDGEISTKPYWSLADTYKSNSRKKVNNYDQAVEELEKIMEKSVAKRIPADTTYGTFLSGGIDSTLVTILAQRLAGAPLKTFTIGFNDPKYNEADVAKQISQLLGTDHTELYIDETMLLELVHDIPEYYDEPFGDSSQIATFFACRLAKSKVDIILTGDAGDILFWGFETYTKLSKIQRLDLVGQALYYILKPLKLLDKMPLKVKMICNNRYTGTKSQVYDTYSDDIINSLLIDPSHKLHFDLEKAYPIKEWAIRKSLVDLQTFAPSLLNKVGSSAAALQLVTRNPYIDLDVVEHSMRLPDDYKYQKGVKKRILKDIIFKTVPREIIDRPKHGFTVPHSRWLKQELADELDRYTSEEFIKKQNLFKFEVLKDLKDQFIKGNSPMDFILKNFFWSFFIFQMWYEKYM